MITVVANLKGGTGKSTVAFNLALWLAEKGGKVSVCDLDPQATLTDVIEVREEDGIEPPLKRLDTLPARATGEVIVDIGMTDMLAVHDALGRCHQVVIPVTPSQADVWSTQQFLAIIAEHAGARKPKVMAFVNRADPHPHSRENAEAFEALASLGGVAVLDARLTQRLAFRRSFSEGLAVFELEPSGKAAAELDILARAVFPG